MSWFKLILGGARAYIVAAAGALALIVGYTFKVKHDTKKDIKQKADKAEADYIKEQLEKRVEHDEKVSNYTDDDLDKRLREQSRYR